MSPCESFFSSRISRKRSPIITVTLPPRTDYVRQYCNSEYDIKSFLRPWSGAERCQAGRRIQHCSNRFAPPSDLFVPSIRSLSALRNDAVVTANCNPIHRAIYEILHSDELPILAGNQ